MGWRCAAPGLIVVLVKLTGTSLFLAFVLQTTQSLPQRPTAHPSEVTTTARVQVQQLRWESYGEKSYGFSEEMLEWSASRMECLDHSSDLVIIKDRKEMEFLRNKTRAADYFIGLEYSVEGNKWLWLDGTETKGNLFTMKPNKVDIDCATLRGGEVSPTSCHQRSHWICEKRNG
ncbi:killer cell lectin-like receptor subfamily B member 1F isoform X2 [Eublepharis macularius]|uniref:Killer cell lectin-like receptor subfamily B member 1F isoform X2 n=1 Tax=Eublepharis macularius TaxID=481883 RepID=A0AA97JU20_EUBMA|nr:killer cell lectin-like receptor subfamily B member 1F isoform X2 [Eublepharis macularius]